MANADAAAAADGGAGYRRLDLRTAYVDAVSDFVRNAVVVVSVSSLCSGIVDVDVDAVVGLVDVGGWCIPWSISLPYHRGWNSLHFHLTRQFRRR